MKVRPSFHSSRLNNHLSRRFVSRHLKLLSVLFVLIAAVLVTNVGSLSASKGTSARRATAKQSSPGAESKRGTQSVASVLNEDGSVKPGVNGSFDVSGFRMQYAPNGAPRFVPASMPASGCASGWDTQFGLNGVEGGTVNALAVMGSDLYVGGDFTTVGNVTANRVAKFNTTTATWSPLGFGDGNGVGRTGSIVYALAVMGSDLYVGGNFMTVNYRGSGGTPEATAYCIAKYDTTAGTWSALGNGNGNGVRGKYVSALAVMGSDLYVGGFFTSVNFYGTGGTPEVPANNIAKFNPNTNTWSALGTGNGNGVNNSVWALAVMGSDLYLGGVFNQVNYGGSGATPQIPGNYIAKFNTTANTWSALGNGSGNGMNKYVDALAVIGSDLYIGGYFTTANYSFTANVQANHVVKFNPTTNTWSALRNGNGNGLDDTVYALAVIGSDLYVGGLFTTANFGGSGGTPAVTVNKIAKFNTTAGVWSALGDGLNSSVNALAIGSDLYVAGDFLLAGDTIASPHVAQWFIQDPPTLTYSNQAVPVNESLIINPATGPSDDVTVSSIAVQSVGSYTGGISVNNETGAVSISNAVPGGTHSLTIRATDNCGAITDASFLLTVTKRATTTTVTSSANPADFGQSVVFTATIASTAGGTPTGTVQFKVDGASVGAPVALDASGVATFTTSSLAGGTHAITADYGGDGTFSPSTGKLTPDQQIKIDCSVPMTVTNSNDSGPGSLREIIKNSCPGGTVTFAANLVSPITLTTGELLIDKNLTITGPGANVLTISGNNSSRVFNIQAGNAVTITDLAIANGKALGGAGVYNDNTLTMTNCDVYGNTAKYGAGLSNSNKGTLTMTNCNVYGNTAQHHGGGVENYGMLTMTACNVSGNNSIYGGGIYSGWGTLGITNSTISGNLAYNGGGIYSNSYNPNYPITTLTNVTITNNRTSGGSGGGIYQSGGTISLLNTIVAGNFQGDNPSTAANDIDGSVSVNSFYNLIGVGGSGGLTNGTNHNQVGVSNALLGALANNGGPTQTHALMPGSPAIDAGYNCVVLALGSGGCRASPLTTDQRGIGFARQVNGTVDIGAFESPLNAANNSSSSKRVAGVPQMFSVNLSNPSPNSDRRRRILMGAAAAGPCCGSRRTPRPGSGS
jgi:hypothetical protein